MGPHLPEVSDQDAPRASCRSNRCEYHCSTIPVLHPAQERPAGYEPPPMICAAVNPPDTRLFFLPPELPGRRNRRRAPWLLCARDALSPNVFRFFALRSRFVTVHRVSRKRNINFARWKLTVSRRPLKFRFQVRQSDI